MLGLEGDVALSNMSGTGSCPNVNFNCSLDVHWLSTLRGRAGFAADDMLVYATAGLAIGGVEASVEDLVVPGVSTFSDTFVGWTAGTGVELAVAENVSLKAEYLYTDLGTRNDGGALDSIGGIDADLSPTFHTVKVGVNFAF